MTPINQPVSPPNVPARPLRELVARDRHVHDARWPTFTGTPQLVGTSSTRGTIYVGPKQIDDDSYRMRGRRAGLAELRAGLNNGGEFS